jgi:molybdopterin-containing oxidoreductase family membrane subunit
VSFRFGDPYDRRMMLSWRPSGTYAPEFWLMIVCNAIVPQVLWFRRARTNTVLLFVVSMLVNVGMWTERFVLIITSQARDFLSSSFHDYVPTPVDGAILFGSFSFFGFLYLLFIRLLPFISAHEVKHLAHESAHGGGAREHA